MLPHPAEAEIFAGGIPGEREHDEEIDEVVIDERMMLWLDADREVHEKIHQSSNVRP